MRILNLLLIEDKSAPRIVESFPIIDEDLSYESVKLGEESLCTYIFGIGYETRVSERDIFEVVNHSYSTGVQKLKGGRYYLIWSSIPE